MYRRDNFYVGEYESSGKILGSGSFATVFEGFHKGSREVVAIKVIDIKAMLRKGVSKKILGQEIAIMKFIKHKNIVQFKNVHMNRESTHIYIVMQYCNRGEFGGFLQKQPRRKLSENDAWIFMRQFAAGLQFIRSKGLMHRDLKPENLLLNEEGGKLVLKIADFGFARFIEHYEMSNTHCGSPRYMAPEIHQGHQYNIKADLWSVGIIMWEMLTGGFPYQNAGTAVKLLQAIDNTPFIFAPKGISISNKCLDLVNKLLTKDPMKRISWDDFFKHPWLKISTSVPKPIAIAPKLTNNIMFTNNPVKIQPQVGNQAVPTHSPVKNQTPPVKQPTPISDSQEAEIADFHIIKTSSEEKLEQEKLAAQKKEAEAREQERIAAEKKAAEEEQKKIEEEEQKKLEQEQQQTEDELERERIEEERRIAEAERLAEEELLAEEAREEAERQRLAKLNQQQQQQQQNETSSDDVVMSDSMQVNLFDMEDTVLSIYAIGSIASEYLENGRKSDALGLFLLVLNYTEMSDNKVKLVQEKSVEPLKSALTALREELRTVHKEFVQKAKSLVHSTELSSKPPQELIADYARELGVCGARSEKKGEYDRCVQLYKQATLLLKALVDNTSQSKVAPILALLQAFEKRLCEVSKRSRYV